MDELDNIYKPVNVELEWMKYGIIYKGCLDGKSGQEIIWRSEQGWYQCAKHNSPKGRRGNIGIGSQNYIVKC